MEIKDAAKKREILESDIWEYLVKKLEKFYVETSLIPSNISISLSPVYTIGQPRPQRVIVEKVEVQIRL